MLFKPNYDLHNHTVYCDHANENATVQNLVSRAGELNLEYLGISEHVRFSEESVAVERIKKDLKKSEVRHEFPLVLLGAELDPDPITMDGRFVAEISDLDYVILSIHRLPESGIGVWRFRELNASKEERRRIGSLWLHWLEACIEYSEFQILGHPLRFPIELDLFDIRDDRVFFQTYNILKKLSQKKAAFELNESFIGTLINSEYLDIYTQMIRELRNSGVKFSRGSDSHNAAAVGKWSNGELLVKLAGITEADWVKPAEWKK